MSAPSPSSLLLGRKTVVKASSTLNRSAEYAASNALDGKEDTCWNSDQGSSQWLLLHFKRRVTVQSVSIVFQGGFVGQDCEVQATVDGNTFVTADTIHPEDVNEPQTFVVGPFEATSLRLMFNRSSDLYGRVIIYRLDVLGFESPAVAGAE